MKTEDPVPAPPLPVVQVVRAGGTCREDSATEVVAAYRDRFIAFRRGGGQPLPARVCETVNFCMSQAPVGHRSAHRPQCRQTSSSLTMTRPVLSVSDT